MASKVYEIGFKLAGKLSSGFKGSFQAGAKIMESFGSKIDTLNKETSKVGGVIKMREEVAIAGQKFREAEQKVESLEKAISETAKPSKQMVANFKQAQLAATKAKESLIHKRAALDKLEASAGTAGMEIHNLVKHQNELKESADRAREAQAKLAKINERIEKSKARSESLKTSAGAGIAQTAAVGAGAGAAAGMFLKGGNDYIVAMNKLQAQIGSTDAEMSEFGVTAREVFKSGKGESIDAVAAAMANIHQASGLAGDALKDATNNALMLGETFDMEVGESSRAASALMKNFGISANEAYGIIAYGAQNGANKNGDLLDTLNEYSVHYKALGFTSSQFVQNLVEGAEAGAFSIDKVGDAVKEFTIRSKDGSKTSMEAYAALGINGEKATAMFAAGGEKAQQAFYGVVEALDQIEDPVKKNAIGVSLFGSQFEDLEAGALKSLLNIHDASVDATGTLKQIEKVRYNDVGTALKQVSRTMTDSLIPASKDAAGALFDAMPAIQASMAKLTPVIAQMGSGLASSMPAIIDGFTSAAESAVNAAIWIKDNWGAIAPVLKYVAASYALLKLGPAVLYPVQMLYTGFLNVSKAVTWARNNTALLSAASKVATATMNGLKTAVSLMGKALKGVGWVAGKALMLAWRAACFVTTTTIKLLTGAVKLLGAGLKFMFTNPIGLAIMAVAGLVTAGVLLYKNWDTVKAKAMELWSAFSSAFPNIASIFSTAFNNIKAIASDVWSVFQNLIGFVKNVFTGQWSAAWENVKGIFGGVFGALVGLVKLPFNSIISLVNSAIGAINGISVDIPDWVPKFGGQKFGLNIPTIPQLADGGIATAPTLAMIGEGNESEAVLPLSKLKSLMGGAGGGSVVVNMTVNVSGGGADAYADVKRGIADGTTSLKRELERLIARDRRLSYI